MNKKTRDFGFEIKAAERGGFFSGYASVFDVVDSYDEIVKRGAFVDTIAEAKAKGRKFPVLWNHNSSEPLGTYSVIREDDHGLYVEGKLLIDSVTRAAEIHQLAADGAISGLSIGFEYRESVLDEESGIRSLTALKLYEISLCCFPANEESRTIAIRRKLDAGELPTITDLEKSLREAMGFSRRQAALIAAKGYRHFLSESGRADNFIAAANLLEKMRGFSLNQK